MPSQKNEERITNQIREAIQDGRDLRDEVERLDREDGARAKELIPGALRLKDVGRGFNVLMHAASVGSRSSFSSAVAVVNERVSLPPRAGEPGTKFLVLCVVLKDERCVEGEVPCVFKIGSSRDEMLLTADPCSAFHPPFLSSTCAARLPQKPFPSPRRFVRRRPGTNLHSSGGKDW